MFKLPKFAKAIAGAVALAGSTALGFLPHTDPWFNILTGVVAVLGIYGIYAIPNKVLAQDVLALLGRVLPAAVVAKIAPLIESVINAVDPAPADPTQPPLTPIPAVTPPVAAPPAAGK
jgi:hypothetical protein